MYIHFYPMSQCVVYYSHHFQARNQILFFSNRNNGYLIQYLVALMILERIAYQRLGG